MIVVRGILLEDDSEVPSVPGVVIQPSETQVRILDDDGQFHFDYQTHIQSRESSACTVMIT